MMSTLDGTEQKARIRGMFDLQAADYDATGPGVFSWFGRRLVEAVGVQPGAHVLDVATGRGAVLFPAAEQAGETGQVIGIDLSPQMVAATSADARRPNNTQVLLMDAEQLEFAEAAFDNVFCGFGIMFFPDQHRALSEFRRVLKPGGRVGISTWQANQSHHLLGVLRDLGVGKPPPPGWITDPDRLAQVLAQAGFTDVHVTPDTHAFRYADIDEYWQVARGTQTRHQLDALDAEQLAQVRAAFTELVQPFQRSDGLYLEATALLAVASR